MIYFASPYSDDDPITVDIRFYNTSEAVAKLINKGFPIFSPIVHNHKLAREYSMPTDAKSWQDYNTNFIRFSESMIVFTLDGWKISKGVQQEIALAKELDIPIRYYTPGHVFIAESQARND